MKGGGEKLRKCVGDKIAWKNGKQVEEGRGEGGKNTERVKGIRVNWKKVHGKRGREANEKGAKNKEGKGKECSGERELLCGRNGKGREGEWEREEREKWKGKIGRMGKGR